jgi:hypothetical protein
VEAVLRRQLYNDDWEKTSAQVRARSRGRCECTGECGLHRGRRCVERHGLAAKWARGKVVLTVHHLNGNKRDDRAKNLLAMCNRCHLRADAPFRSEKQKLAQDRKTGQGRFWPLEERP